MFNEAGGSFLRDLVGNRNGSVTGGLGTDLVWVPGRDGIALKSVANVGSSRVSISSLTTGTIWTWEGRVKATTFNDSWGAIFTQGAGSGLYIRASALFRVEAGTGLYSNSTLVAGTWYHIVATCDGSTIRIYFNGKEDASGASGASPTFNADSMFNNAGSDTFDGIIDYQRFWKDRALTASEVRALFSDPYGMFVPARRFMLPAAVSGGGVTAVGVDMQAVWTTRAAVGKSTDCRWTTRATVGRSTQAIWTTRACVGVSRQFLWNIRTLVGISSQYLWTVRALAGKSNQFLWTTSSNITTSGITPGGQWHFDPGVGSRIPRPRARTIDFNETHLLHPARGRQLLAVLSEDEVRQLIAAAVGNLPVIPTAVGMVPVGGIAGWHKNMPGCPVLPDQFAECNGQTLSDPESPFNGQTLPDFNSANRFLRGALASGGVGGASSHSHTYNNAQSAAAGGDFQAVENSGGTTTADHTPPYFDVVWVIRIK